MRSIEQEFRLPQRELWKQRDFEFLSDLIVKKTGVRLSISTLKRIWKDSGTLPQLHTLNVLARVSGFASWSDFKQQQGLYKAPGGADKKARTHKSNAKYFLLLPPVLIVLFLFYFKPYTKEYQQSDILFKSRKNVAAGVPNTVVFEYDISTLDFDSAFIQHTWDERLRSELTKDNHFQTFIYYYPGYHTAKLILNDQTVKTEYVNIKTDGWEALVDGIPESTQPIYIPRNDFYARNQLYVSPETLYVKADGKTFWVNYFNVRDFQEVYGENFTLDTRLKNSLEEGGFVCQYAQMTIICENSLISIPFCNPGCAANIHLHISDVLKNGRKNDLSAFGSDLSEWRNIRIKSVNKHVAVYMDEKEIFNQSYSRDLGRITGLHYKFYGCGAVDMIRLYNAADQLAFSDNFSEPETQHP